MGLRSVYIFYFLLSSCTYSASANDTRPCPKQFFSLTLPEHSQQCRIFGVKKPTTLSFFVPASEDVVTQGFVTQLATPQIQHTPGYVEILSDTTGHRLYIYRDGSGTQVNIRAE